MRVWLACMTTFLASPLAAVATDINSGLRSDMNWTDNVYSQSEGELDDFSGRIAPWAEVADPDGNFTWGLRYAPTYEYYVDEDGLRGFDHDIEGRLGWRVAPQTTVRLAERFRRFHSVSRFNEQAAPGEDVVAVGERVRYKNNFVSGSLEHLFGPRDVVTVSAYHNYQDFAGATQPQRDFLGTGLVYQHSWDARTILGARASWSRQTLSDWETLAGEDVDDRSTDYFNVSGVFRREISRSLFFELSAGPAYILSDVDDFVLPPAGVRLNFPVLRLGGQPRLVDADTCPRNKAGERILSTQCGVFSPPLTEGQAAVLQLNRVSVPITGTVPDADDSTLTYFADVSLVKEWERLSAELTYERRESQSSGFGAVSDIFYGALRWQVTRRLSAKWLTSYEIREQATDSIVFVTTVSNQAPPPFLSGTYALAAQTQAIHPDLVSRNVGLDLFVTNVGLTYQLTRRSAIYTNIYWRDEQSTGDVVLQRDMQRLGITVGINYVFDPYEL